MYIRSFILIYVLHIRIFTFYRHFSRLCVDDRCSSVEFDNTLNLFIFHDDVFKINVNIVILEKP